MNPSTRARGALCATVLASAAGCTFDRGEAFGTLEATLTAHLVVPADRDLGDGFQRLASDYQVRVVRADVVIDAVIVEDAGEAPTGVGFDPASPPEGYSLCHTGHCHSAEGRLVPYEEIAAELASGEGGTTIAASLEVGTLPLLSEAPRDLECGACSLDRGRLRRVRLVVRGLDLELEVRDGRAKRRIAGTVTARGTIDLATPAEGAEVAPGELIAIIDAPVDDDAPRIVELALALAPDVSLLDGVDFAALPDGGGALDLGAATDDLRNRFQTLELDAQVARRDE